MLRWRWQGSNLRVRRPLLAARFYRLNYSAKDLAAEAAATWVACCASESNRWQRRPHAMPCRCFTSADGSESGCGDPTRTDDLRVMSPSRFQLRYAAMNV